MHFSILAPFIILASFFFIFVLSKQKHEEGFELKSEINYWQPELRPSKFIRDGIVEADLSKMSKTDLLGLIFEQMSDSTMEIPGMTRYMYNMRQLEKQVSQEELVYYLKNGIWPWPKELIETYEEAYASSTLGLYNPKQATDKDRHYLTQAAAEQKLLWTAPEGQFLISKCIPTNPWDPIHKPSRLHKPLTKNGFEESCNPCLALDNPYSTEKCQFLAPGQTKNSKWWAKYFGIAEV